MHYSIKFMYGLFITYASLKNVEALLASSEISSTNRKHLSKAHKINTYNLNLYLKKFEKIELEQILRDKDLQKSLIDYEKIHSGIDLSKLVEGTPIRAESLDNVKQFGTTFFQNHFPLDDEIINDILIRYDNSFGN